MKCIYKYDYVHLTQETFVSPVLEFDMDITNDEFEYSIRGRYIRDKEVYPVAKIDENTAFIEPVDLPLGQYKHELVWTRNGVSVMVFQGDFKVTNNPAECRNRKDTLPIRVEKIENILPVVLKEAIVYKGPKGDAFTYDDFTPEQIEELQRPATEAAQTASQAADNANTATQNAITATNEANTATVSANQSAQTANASATNADNSADLATSAATNANNAVTAANTAADFANSQRGWSPKFVFEEDGATRLVKKLDSWIGGTGTAPTDNVGMYVIDGGYTTDKSLATNFKGAQSDNLIVEYVHSGNKDVYIDSIDYDTNTFTSVGHGLVNGNRLGLNLLKQIYDASQSPFTKLPVNTMVYSGFHVVNITTDTFQISTTNGGNPITLINQSTLDLSFFRFEVVRNISGLTFSNVNHNDIEIKVVGGFARNPRYIIFKGQGLGIVGFSSRINEFANLFHDGLWSLGGTYSMSIITNNKEEVKQRNWTSLQFSPMLNNGVINEISYSIDNTKNSLQILGGFSPYNGTTIKIYKL